MSLVSIQHGKFTFRPTPVGSGPTTYRVEYGGFEIGTVERAFEDRDYRRQRWLCRAPFPSPFDEARPDGEARLWKVLGSQKRTRLDSAKELLLIHQTVRGIA